MEDFVYNGAGHLCSPLHVAINVYAQAICRLSQLRYLTHQQLIILSSCCSSPYAAY